MQNRGTVCVLEMRPELQSLLAVLMKRPNIQCVLSVVDPCTISFNLHSNHRRWPQVRKLRHRDNCDLFKEMHLLSGKLGFKPSLLTLSLLLATVVRCLSVRCLRQHSAQLLPCAEISPCLIPGRRKSLDPSRCAVKGFVRENSDMRWGMYVFECEVRL